jgi:MscS family membrane protein
MRTIWRYEYFGFQVWEIAWLGFTFLLGLVTARLISLVIMRILKKYMTRVPHIDCVFSSSRFSTPFTAIFLGWLWYWGATRINFSANDLHTFSILAKTLTYFGTTWAIWQSAEVFKAIFLNWNAKKQTPIDALMGPMISIFVHFLAIIFGIIAFADLFNFPLPSLLTGLGLGGFAVAMAAKETVGNVFGSATIIMDKPFQIGDWVKIGDVEGNVETVGFRSTRIRTFHDSLVTIPNANLQTAVIDNMGARTYRRFKTTLHLAVETPHDVVSTCCKEIADILKKSPLVKEESVLVAIQEITPLHGITLSVTCYLICKDANEEHAEKHRLLHLFLETINRLGISLKKV